MLNYFAMKQLKLKKRIALLGLVTLLSACARSPENTATANGNSAQQANGNSQQPVAQGTPSDASPSVTPPTVQTIPPPAAPVQPQATVNGNPKKPAPAPNERAPKLIAPAKRLEFGKQPQDKTLVRAISIRNGGRADLKVESVTPS
ncbi:MAG TPA: hypothetical protein VN937_26120 [Blastocatellia bacterium]|nr:hypothetical protein [Blastocatellia bacterium]